MFQIGRVLASHAAADPDDTLRAKQALHRLGWFEIPEYGMNEYPDRPLFDAITRFQRAHGLKPDGVINPGGETEAALSASLRTKALPRSLLSGPTRPAAGDGAGQIIPVPDAQVYRRAKWPTLPSLEGGAAPRPSGSLGQFNSRGIPGRMSVPHEYGPDLAPPAGPFIVHSQESKSASSDKDGATPGEEAKGETDKKRTKKDDDNSDEQGFQEDRDFITKEEFDEMPEKGLLDPQRIRTAQGKMKNVFRDGRPVDQLTNEYRSGKNPWEVEEIAIGEVDGKIYSDATRRVAAGRRAGVNVAYRKVKPGDPLYQNILNKLSENKIPDGEHVIVKGGGRQ